MKTKLQKLQDYCRGLKEQDWADIAEHVEFMHERCNFARILVGQRKDEEELDGPHHE